MALFRLFGTGKAESASFVFRGQGAYEVRRKLYRKDCRFLFSDKIRRSLESRRG